MRDLNSIFKHFFFTITGICLFAFFSLDLSAQAGQCLGGGCTATGTSYGSAQTTTSTSFVSSLSLTYAGEYNTYDVTSGQQYEWSLCMADGAVNGSGDSQLTLKNTSNTILCYSDDLCGSAPKILWTANFTGQVRVLINQYSCVTNTLSHTVVWRCVTCGGGGGPCAAAINIPSAPVTNQSLVCTGTAVPGNLNATNVPTACGGATNSYKGGQEALYTFTPTVTGSYTISYSGQSWSAIFVYSGACPASGGTCVGSVGSSASSQSLAVSLTSGVLYYIWFDTWPSPNSPCAGTFSIAAPAGNPCSSIATISGCGVSTTSTHTGSGSYNPPSTSCGFSTPGQEKIYQFTAPTTGTYQLNVTSATGGYIDYFYKAASGGCSNTGWTCIDDITLPTTVTLGSLVSGTTYYILLDPEGTGSYSHTFNIICPAVDPCSAITTISACGVSTTSTHSGSGSYNPPSATCGFSTPGQEKIYQFTAPTTGTYQLNVTSATGGYIDYFYKAASGGCSSTGWTCILDINAPTTVTLGSLVSGTTYYILLDPEGTGSYSHTFNIICPIADPCSAITTISACGVSTTSSHSGSGAGWNVTTCGFSTPGQEKVYQFTAPTTGTYQVNVSSSTGSYIDYFWKAASGGCGSTGWNCIDDIISTGTYGAMSFTAGTTYYILLDPESSGSVTHTFSLVCPVLPAYKANFISMNTGASNWCAGETRTVSVTVQNTGTATWTNSGPDINIGVKWNYEADYFVRVDANNLAPGNTATYNLTITAPMSSGGYDLRFDVVNESSCWFGNNNGVCGPGNSVFISPSITVNPLPSAPTGVTASPSTICTPGSAVQLNATSAGNTIRWYTVPTGGSNIGTSGSGANFQVNPGSTTTYYAEALTGAGCVSTSRTSVTVTVGDTTPPTINCPSSVTVGNTTGQCGATVNYITPAGSDNCPGATTMQLTGLPSGSFFPVGTTLNTFMVTAANSQTAMCNFTVTVNDTQPPNANCQNVTVQLDGSGTGSVSAAQVNNSSVDNCGVTGTLLLGTTSYNCGHAGGTVSVTLQVSDAAGNTATCSSTITVQDVTAPHVSCKDHSVNLSGSSASVSQADVYDSGSDNCGTIILSSVSPNSFTCANTGTNTVVLTVSDGSGNTGTCSATVTVTDITPPIFTYCPDNMVVDADENCIALVSWTTPVASDNCGFSFIQTEGTESGEYFVFGTTTVTYVATDDSGNSASCSFTVTVQDVTPPVVACLPTVVTVPFTGSSVTIAPEDVIWYGYDNCGYLYFNGVSPDSFNCSHAGISQTVVLTVNDGNGNTSTCSASVMVVDTEVPTANCQNISVNLDASGNVSIAAGDINNDSSDNCGVASMSLDVTDFDCEDVGENTVTLTVTDVNGNSSECTATVTVNDVTNPDAQCQNFSVNLDVNNTATISEDDIDNGSSDACGLASLSVYPNSFGCGDVGENTVTLTVYDNNGNSSSCTSTVTVVDTEPPVAGCQDVTVTLDENGTGSLSAEQVNNSSSDNCDFDLLLDQTDFTCANQGSNTVTLTVTDESGNSATCSATVTVNLGYSVSINPSGSTALCENECIYLDAGLFASYLWSANAGSSTDQTVEVCDAGNYSVTVTDTNGCTSSAEISVTVNPLPTPEITADGATSFCDGGSVELDAGEYSSYQWNALGGNATTQTITTTEAGTYSVTVTDANGCTGVDNIEITIYDLPVVSVDGVTQVCEGGTLNFSASGGNGYTWVGPNDFSSSSDNVTITNADASMTGTYTVTVTNENGCTSEYEVEVLVNTAPDAQITGNFVVCQDDDLTLVATGGTTYSWSGPNGYSSTGATLVRTNFDATMVGTYSVTVSDNIGCSAETSVTVSISGSGFTVNVTGNTNTCIGGSISLTASAVGAVSYSWLGPDGFVSNGASFTRLNATAGMSGIYTVFVTNANGCVITATREVTVSSTTAIVTGTTNVCVGGSINLIASGGNTYQWSGPGGFSSTGHSILRTNANTTMSGVYSVTVSNALGCTGTANITVTVHPNPSATLTGTSTICSGGTITITAPAGATSYLWSGPNGFTATGGPSMTRTNANTTMTGQYKVTVTNAGGCTATAARSVSVSAPTSAAVTPTTTTTNFCSNANVVFTATTAGVAYNWSGPGGFTATTAAISAPPVAGAYMVTVTLSTGCIATATRNAAIVAAPNAVITGNLNVCVGGTISLLASGGTSYNWSGPGGYTRVGNSVLRTGATTAMSGTYTVTVTGSGGCKSTASVVVTVSACKNGEDAIAFETLFAYPNPTNNQTTITFTALKAELMHLSVFAIDGREVAVLFDDMTEAETPYSFELDMSHLPSGTYYAVLRRSDGAAQHLRLMVVR